MLAQKMRKTKAISPILATLLLIVIAVAAIVVTYAWVMTYMSGATRRAGENLAVENVMFSGSQVSITIRNTGTSDSKIVAIYAGTSSANLTSRTVSPTLPHLVQVNNATTFNVTLSWTSGTRYYFKAVTESGLNLPFDEQP